jgi:hypothetical protein
MELELIKLIILFLIVFSLILASSLVFVGLIHKSSEVIMD